MCLVSGGSSCLKVKYQFPAFLGLFISRYIDGDKSSCVLNVDEVEQQAFLWIWTYVYKLFIHLAGDSNGSMLVSLSDP